MEFRKPKRNAAGGVDVEINHPALGWIPFTVDPTDTGAGFDTLALSAAIAAAGGIAPYVAPPAPSPAPPDPVWEAIDLIAATLPKAVGDQVRGKRPARITKGAL